MDGLFHGLRHDGRFAERSDDGYQRIFSSETRCDDIRTHFKRDSRESSSSAESHLSISSSQIPSSTKKPPRALVMSAPKISVYSLSGA